LAGVVWRETEGNPFFVSEVLRHLVETKAVEQRAGRWVLTSAVDELGIPEGVREVIDRRLARLSVGANKFLSAASVFDGEIHLGVVSAVAELDEDTVVAVSGDGAAVRIDTEPMRRALGQLVRATRRHGGLDRVEVSVAGPVITIGPLTEYSAPVVLGRELRELQAAAAVALVDALGGSVAEESGRLVIRLPAA
jgi:hypothetical protein